MLICVLVHAWKCMQANVRERSCLHLRARVFWCITLAQTQKELVFTIAHQRKQPHKKTHIVKQTYEHIQHQIRSLQICVYDYLTKRQENIFMIAFRFFNSAFWEVLRRELRKSRHNLHLRFPAVFPVLRQRTLRLAC